jgi:protein-tyrosine-phosphatase
MNAELSSVQRRARIHAALGDPARLAIVDTLTLGDASPGEIARALDLPTNLVAHHVKVLDEAGLLVRTRSEGDRRRTYLRLEPGALASLAAPVLTDVARVVFVCTHNSARSQLAAALWTDRATIPAASAGTQPAARVHPRAVKVARRHGLLIDATGTAHVADVVHETDLVVAVCDNAHEDLTRGVRPRLHWSVPAPADTDAAFEATFADLAARIDRLAPALQPVATPAPTQRTGARND